MKRPLISLLLGLAAIRSISPDRVWLKSHYKSTFNATNKSKSYVIERRFSTYVPHRPLVNVSFPSYAVFCPNGMKDPLVRAVRLARTRMWSWICHTGSEQLVLQGMVHVLRAFAASTSDAASPSAASDAACLVVDAGSNTGFFGLVAMSFGCDVKFFDVQKSCLDFVSGAVEVNAFRARGDLHHIGLSDGPGEMAISTKGICRGVGYLLQPEVHAASSTTTNTTGNVTSPNLDVVRVASLPSLLEPRRKVLILKVDTEGSEYHILRGALPMFRRRQILNVFVEVTPCCGFWARAGVNRTQVAALFTEIASFGYGMWTLGDPVKDGKYNHTKAPELFRTPREIGAYIEYGDFLQQDMWLFLLGNQRSERAFDERAQ